MLKSRQLLLDASVTLCVERNMEVGSGENETNLTYAGRITKEFRKKHMHQGGTIGLHATSSTRRDNQNRTLS
jgi:hypothetical protein